MVPSAPATPLRTPQAVRDALRVAASPSPADTASQRALALAILRGPYGVQSRQVSA